MTDIDTKATHCKRLLEDPYLKEAFDEVRDAILEVFKDHTPFTQEPVSVSFLDLLSYRLQTVDSIWDNLEQALKDQEIEVHIQKMSGTDG